MRRRYVLIGMGLVLAIAVAAPVIAQNASKSGVNKATKKAIKKEVAKRLRNKTRPSGPAGVAGTPGATGPRGPSDAFIKERFQGGLGVTPSSVVQINGAEAPGTFAFIGVVEVVDTNNGTSNNGVVVCRLVREGPAGDTTLADASLAVGESEGGKVQRGMLTLAANASIGGGLLDVNLDLRCDADKAAASVNALGRLQAIQVEDSTDLTP